jgi:molybdenum cofactor biosynthesis enzyme MoaA
MPEDGVQLTPSNHLLSPPELIRIARLFVDLGVTKIRLTGGEPTLRPDLADLCSELSELPGLRTLAMTTNGVLLSNKLLSKLRSSGLTNLNISLDTLQRERFEAIARRPVAHWDRVMSGIDAARLHGFAALKLNVVVTRGVNDDEIFDFLELTRELKNGTSSVTVRFIELMPFAGNDWSPKKIVPGGEIVKRIRERHPDFAPLPRESSVDSVGGPEELWSVPGFAGCIGFISSMTDAFCGTCNRLRLTADGSIKACLHSNDEMSLREVLRAGGSDSELINVIAEAVRGKRAVLGGNGDMMGVAGAALGAGARAMVRIGG